LVEHPKPGARAPGVRFQANRLRADPGARPWSWRAPLMGACPMRCMCSWRFWPTALAGWLKNSLDISATPV